MIDRNGRTIPNGIGTTMATTTMAMGEEETEVEGVEVGLESTSKCDVNQ